MPINPSIVGSGQNPSSAQAGTGTGTHMSQPAQSTYTFDGQTYNTYEAANAARDKYIADRKNKALSIYADAASVGFDKSKFDALMQTGAGLSQMSDAERSFITKRYQASNPYERKSYTNSAADQYLASAGMPAYSELNTYRKAYYDYVSGGGVLDNFPGLDDDTYRYISKHWQDGMQTSIDGKLYTAKGKEVQYKDTLLDDQLKSAGLPPAAMINDYFLDYQQDKQIDTDIKDFYAAVYEKTKGGMSSEEAYRTTLAESKYLPLAQYVSEAVVYPNEADYTDNDVLSDTYGKTDKAKFDAAWNKALTADAKRDAMDHRVSYADYDSYSTMRNAAKRGEELSEKYSTARENASKWFTTPATSDAEKQQRATEMKQYFDVYSPGTTVESMQKYFSLLDAGVPADVLATGSYASVSDWNETKNAGSDSYADVKLLAQGYSTDDGDYADNRKIVQQTKDWAKRSGYESSSLYREDLYEKETYAGGYALRMSPERAVYALRVSPEGAVYAEVNGITGDNHAPVEYADSPEYELYSTVSSADSSGKRLCDYMTDEERGVFNSMYQHTPARAMEYLDGLSDMLEDRRYVDSAGTFAARLATDGVNVSEGEIADHIYDALLYEQGQALEDVNPEKPDAWHLDAWKKYAGYSDEVLQQIAAEADVDPLLHGPNEAQWVLDTRKELRTRANVEASLYGYTDEAGKAATAEHDYATVGAIVADSDVSTIYNDLLSQYGQMLEGDSSDWVDDKHLNNWRKYSDYSDDDVRQTWQTYVGYTDEELQQIANEPAPDDDPYAPSDAADVLEIRQELMAKAKAQASSSASPIVPEAPEIRETSFAEQFARSTMDGPDWSSTIEYIKDGGYAHDVEQPIFDQMTESQRDQYNWLYENKGPEAAQAYYQMIRPYLDETAANEIREENKAYGKGHKFGASLASVPGTFLSGMTGLVGTGLNLATGTELTKSQAASWNFSNQWREGVSEDWAPGWQLLYGTGMSMADSAITALMAAAGMPAGTVVEGGLVADFATAWMASSAYTATLDSAMARGLDPSQAYGTALVAGLAEYVTEKISLDSLLEGVGTVAKSGKGAHTKAYFTNVAKQAFVEGSEEVNSDIINFLWDNLVNGDMSEFNQNVDSLIDAGYTREEARQIAWKQQIIETSLSFAGGALSGGLMGAAGGGFGVRAALYDYAFGAEGTQAGTSASAPAQTGASVRAHADAFSNGRSIVDKIFGQTVGNNAMYALDNKETEETAKRIDAISDGIANLDNTSYLYGYTHDAEGNLTLTDDQRVALASVLALAYEDANENNMDSAFIHAMASLQTDQQRAANTNYDWIKNAQDVRNVIDQIAKTQEAITTIETEQQTKLADAQSAYSAAAAEVAAITKRIEAATDIKEKSSLMATQKTAQDKADNLKARLNTIETTGAANAKAQVKAAKEEVARQQTLLDRHYASSSAFLSEYAPASFDGATASRASATARRNDAGAKIDAIISSDMSDSDKQKALAPLRQQQASAVGSIHAIDTRLANADPAALSNAMNAMKSNSVSDFIKEQSEAAQKAAESSQGSDVEEPSNTNENGENKAAESVKQDDTAQSKAKEKKTVTIGPRVQQTFNRIAKKFGCEIVWGEDSTAIGETGQILKGRNGAYNPDEPNKIYLNKAMMCDRSLSSTQAVAREFFAHEIVHYVSNTKTYRNIMARAAAYYNTVYGKNGADTLVNAIIADEQQRGNTGFGRKQALEEMTAHFAQEVLFADDNGTRRALVWLARSDSNMVNNFLNMVEYLIKRGNVRKASDGNTVKTMLIDAEFELITALKERQYLDTHGKTNAFERRSTTQTEASTTGEVANSRQDRSQLSDYQRAEAVRYGLSEQEYREAQGYFLTAEEYSQTKKRGVSLDWTIKNKYKSLGLDKTDLDNARILRLSPEEYKDLKDIRNSGHYKQYGEEAPSYLTQLKDWQARNKATGKTDQRAQFFVCDMSDFYGDFGIMHDELFFPAQKLLAVKKKHMEMSNRVIGQLDRIIQDPVMVMFSKDENNINRLVLFGNVFAENGLPVMLAIEPSAKEFGKDIYANRLMSAYTRCDPELLQSLVASEEYKNASKEERSAMMKKVGRENDYTQSLLDTSEILWVNPDKKITDTWISRSRLQLPLGATYGYNGRLSHLNGAVKSQNSEGTAKRGETPVEKVSDIRAIFTGKGEGHSGVMNSRGMTTDEYMALDFSKNKMLQKNGRPYRELYSGSNYSGFTIFDPRYADDFLSTFATDSKLVAQSYTRGVEKTGEYDPRSADRNREQLNVLKGDYMRIAEDGQYDTLANRDLYEMLNKRTDYVFDPQNDGGMQEADLNVRDLDDGQERRLGFAGIRLAKQIQYAVTHLATHHSVDDYNEVKTAYSELEVINNQLAPAAEEERDRLRKDYDADNYQTYSLEKMPENSPLLVVQSYLRTLQTYVKDVIIDGGIYEALQEADAEMRQLVDPDTGELLRQTGPNEWAVPEDLYVGFEPTYKGKARLFSKQERWEQLPIYEGEPGYYKLKIYAENPLDVNVRGQRWDNMDVNAFPPDVRQKLADLYGYKLGYKTREVSRAAYECGYDGVVFRWLIDTGSWDVYEPADIIITYKPYQSKSIYNENPTTNPDIMFSTGMSIDDYIQRYGQKEQNAFGRANNILTPDYVDNDAGRRFRVSDTAQTLKEVPHIRQSVRNMIDEGILQQADGLVERHGLVYEPVSVVRMREMGDQYIAEHGSLTQSMRDLTRDMPRARANELVQYMAAANKVFTEIGAEGTFDPQDYYEFVASYVEMRSTWGRVGRVMQLVNDSPLGRVAYWQRVVQRLNEKNSEAVRRGINPLFYRNGGLEIDVPQSFYDALAQAQTPEEIEAAEYAITQYIGQNSPLTVGDALRNWRYFAMLANPVTHMRNLLGNLTMLGGRIAKDTIASGMENLAVRRGLMSADERTHATVLRQDADTRAYVRQLWEENARAVQSGGRDGFQQTLDEARRKSPFRLIDAAMRFNTNGVENSSNPFLRNIGLENEDRIFLGATFRAAAAQYIQAQGLDVNNLTREQRGAIVNYATQQAQEATYRDASRLADALNQFAKSGWAAQLFVDAVIPFKKTPINIFKRGIEYSPAGIARGLVDIARNATAQRRGGQPVVSASVVVDELAKGLTGSMLALLGFFLSKAGILKVRAGDDDKDSSFEKDIGRQDYSLEIGDVSIKIESLAPLTFPLFMGAQLQRLTSTEHDGLSLSDLTDAASTLADPLMDMSFMSGLNSVLSTYNENKIGGVVTNAAEAYLGQYLPTIGSKLNQTINTQRRTSKASQASPVGTNMDYWLRSMASKVPGVNQAVLEPYVKTTGEYDAKDSFGDYVLSFLNNFVSPVNVQIIDTTPVNTEISRLVTATGATDFVPQNPKKYLVIGNERYNMTAKEYTMYSKEHNETVYAVLSQVIQSDAYARMTDEQRAEMLKKAYDRAHRTIMDKYKSVFAQK